MTDAEMMSVLSELTAAHGQAGRLTVTCEEAGQADRARLSREKAAALKREKDRLTRRLLRDWTGDAAALAADLARRNQELAARAEALRQDISRAEAFTEAIGFLDGILAMVKRIA